MSKNPTSGEARAAAPPACVAPHAVRPPDVRFALRLIMLAGSEGHGGSRGDSTTGLLGRRARIG